MVESATTYRTALQEFLTEEVYPYADDWERERTFPRHIVRSLGQKGFFAACLCTQEVAPKRVLPLKMDMFSILIEELAKTRCFGLTLTVSMHVGVFLPLIIHLAHAEVRTPLIEKAINGEVLGTIAATEASAGSDFMGLECKAVFDTEHVLLEGQKHYITNAAVADYIVVFARWRPERHFASFCALLVPTGCTGVQSTVTAMAVMKTAVVSQVTFDQVELPLTSVLGRKELGMHYFLQHIAVERLSGGIWAVVVAEQCLAEAQRFTAQRMVGQETLWARSAVSQRLAQAVVQVALLRAQVERAFADADTCGNVDAFSSAIVKAAAAPIMEAVIGTCLQLQGARGLEADSPLLRLLNDFRVFGVAGGPTEVMLDIISELWAQQIAKKG